MIQNIEPRAFHNEFRPRAPKNGDYVLVYGEDKVWLINENLGAAPVGGDLDALPPAILLYEQFNEIAPDVSENIIFLFTVDDSAFFYAKAGLISETVRERLVEKPSGYFRSYGEKWLGFAGTTACHLAGWYERRRLCGKCGAENKRSDKERMLECPLCGATYYPRISPAVIVGVTDGDRLLLTRYANRPVANYALIAGFCEIGETVEETVRREVMEETGVRVKNVRYYKSQPWGFSGSLLLGFYCDLDGDAAITLDGNELATAEWIERGSIPVTDTTISLTGEMIESFRLNQPLIF